MKQKLQTMPRVPSAFAWILVLSLVFNQFAIGNISAHMGMGIPLSFGALFGIAPAHAAEIVMPMLNTDGKTTNLQFMPTISPPSTTKSKSLVGQAQATMTGQGAPFYAPQGIRFEDPIGAQSTWGSYEKLPLSSDLEARYQRLIDQFTCNFCCGSPADVTKNRFCACAHAQAARGFFRYLLKTYSNTYTDKQLFGEAYRWQAAWYPRGAAEDYLLATGHGDVLGHKTHGGAGADGFHGMMK